MSLKHETGRELKRKGTASLRVKNTIFMRNLIKTKQPSIRLAYVQLQQVPSALALLEQQQHCTICLFCSDSLHRR
uniref:Uncharacterized protein n=1 Tax=Oryza brachyantha TaxID=4533 RepID=J3LJW3_ORYBR